MGDRIIVMGTRCADQTSHDGKPFSRPSPFYLFIYPFYSKWVNICMLLFIVNGAHFEYISCC